MREMRAPEGPSPPERAPTEKYAGGVGMGQPDVLGQDISDSTLATYQERSRASSAPTRVRQFWAVHDLFLERDVVLADLRNRARDERWPRPAVLEDVPAQGEGVAEQLRHDHPLEQPRLSRG